LKSNINNISEKENNLLGRFADINQGWKYLFDQSDFPFPDTMIPYRINTSVAAL